MDTVSELLKALFFVVFISGEWIIRFVFWKELRPEVDSRIKGIPLYMIWDVLWLLIALNGFLSDRDSAFIGSVLLVIYTMRDTQKMKTVDIKNQMAAEEYKRLTEMNQEIQYLRHDWKNHLLAMSSMMEEQKYEEMRAYLGELHGSFTTKPTDILSGNNMIDAILRQKISSAKEKQIDVQIKYDCMEGLKLTDKDICIILSNLYDNAIEAASYVKENPWIRVSIVRNGNMLMIKFSNNYVKKPKKLLDKYMSGKKDNDLHGYGLLSVKHALKKYGGELDTEYIEEKFFATVIVYDGFEDGN